jgi:hypothetical protein
MEAIKTKYDRILLGLCALIALVIGAMLIFNILSFSGTFVPPPKSGKELADIGADKSEDIAKAIEVLNAKSKVTPLPLPGGRAAYLMVSSPVIKTSDGVEVDILAEGSAPLRAPISNAWLYDNELDLTRDDVAQQDFDGDGYSNAEEFDGKSNPRNRSDVPPFYSKLRYKECLKDPLSLKFAVYNASSGEIQLSRTEPKPSRSAFMKEGETFTVDPRFKIRKVEMREETVDSVTKQVPYLIIDDSEAKGAPAIEIGLGKIAERPTFSAKMVDELSSKEFTLRDGQEFELPKMAGTKILVVKVTEDTVVISFIMPGKTERKEVELKIK